MEHSAVAMVTLSEAGQPRTGSAYLPTTTTISNIIEHPVSSISQTSLSVCMFHCVCLSVCLSAFPSVHPTVCSAFPFVVLFK